MSTINSNVIDSNLESTHTNSKQSVPISIQKVYKFKKTKCSLSIFRQSIIVHILLDTSCKILSQSSSLIKLQKKIKVNPFLQQVFKDVQNTYTITEEISSDQSLFNIQTAIILHKIHIDIETTYTVGEDGYPYAKTIVLIKGLRNDLLRKMAAQYVKRRIKQCRKEEQTQLQSFIIERT